MSHYLVEQLKFVRTRRSGLLLEKLSEVYFGRTEPLSLFRNSY